MNAKKLLSLSLGAALVTLCVAQSAHADGDYHPRDPHFRTYGYYSDGYTDLSFREGAAGHVTHSDIVTVGKLDGNTLGPFANLEDEADVAQRWMWLRESSPEVVNYDRVKGWQPRLGQFRDQLIEAMLPDLCQWEARLGRSVYQSYIRGLTGQSSPYYYMKDALEAQFQAERSAIPVWIRGKLEELDAQHSGVLPQFHPIVNVEVANEPNMFPAIPPRLYAWYYLKYRKEVLSVLSAINQERRAQGKNEAEVRMLPAGLWMMDGFPRSVRDVIDNGVSATVAGVTLDARAYSDAGAYLREFIRYLQRPQYLTSNGRFQSFYDETGRQFTSVMKYDFENFGNLKNVVYGYYTTLGQFVGTSLRNKANQPYIRMPYSWTADAPNQLIDIGNLHFYPYIGPASSASLSSQLNGLRELSNYYAQQTGRYKVWLTETGNINSGDDYFVVHQVMNPMFESMWNMPAISRWYWFKNEGEDHKFELLSDMPSSGDLGAWYTAWWLFGSEQGAPFTLGRLINLIPGFAIHVPVSPGAMSDIRAILESWRTSKPRQGLKEENGEMRELGWWYSAWADSAAHEYLDYGEYLEYE